MRFRSNQYWFDSLIGNFFHFQKALLHFCLCQHTAPNGVVQSCILANSPTRWLIAQPETQAASWIPSPDPGAGTSCIFLASDSSAPFILFLFKKSVVLIFIYL